MKREGSDESEGHGESSQGWPPGLFDEIVDLLAEALVLDYQRFSGGTVSSPRGLNHADASRLSLIVWRRWATS